MKKSDADHVLKFLPLDFKTKKDPGFLLGLFEVSV
jgi:hypothetical protein